MKDYTPRPWGPQMIDHAVEHRRCALWAPMGSGKTSTVLTAADALQLAGGDVWPALAIGPLRVARKVWREEVGKWTHTAGIDVRQIIGDVEQRKLGMQRGGQLYTVNYENIPWLVEQYGDAWPFRTIIADEARKLKGHRLKQGGVITTALAEVAWHRRTRRLIELTGTPSPNGMKDLWGQLWFLDRGHRLGKSFKAFENRWFAYKRVQDAVNPAKTHIQTIILPGAQQEIQELIKDLCLSIDLRDYFDLKEPIRRTVTVELPPAVRVLYREMERKLFIQIEEHRIEAFAAAAKSIKLLQLANGAVYLDPDVENDEDPRARAYKVVHDAKIDALKSVIEEMGDIPILVAVQFKSDIARLLKAIPGSRLLHSEKDEDDFKAGNIPVLIAHPKSAGHGIDGFQLVTNVIAFYGMWWDLELRQQIIERIGPTRQMQAGLDRPVFVYDIVAEDTIDEDVLLRHESKRSVQDILMAAVKRRGGSSAL